MDYRIYYFQIQSDFGPVHTYPDTFESVYFFSGYAFHPHASAESDLRIRKLLNLLSRVETFESDIVSDTCGRSNPKTFESDDVA